MEVYLRRTLQGLVHTSLLITLQLQNNLKQVIQLI